MYLAAVPLSCTQNTWLFLSPCSDVAMERRPLFAMCASEMERLFLWGLLLSNWNPRIHGFRDFIPSPWSWVSYTFSHSLQVRHPQGQILRPKAHLQRISAAMLRGALWRIRLKDTPSFLHVHHRGVPLWRPHVMKQDPTESSGTRRAVIPMPLSSAGDLLGDYSEWTAWSLNIRGREEKKKHSCLSFLLAHHLVGARTAPILVTSVSSIPQCLQPPWDEEGARHPDLESSICIG